MIAEIPEYSHHDKTPEMDQSHADTDSKYPVGLILILILTGFATLGSLMTIFNQLIIIGTFVITGLPALIYGIIRTGIYIALFVWIIQRKEWGRKLGIIISIFNILFITLNYLSLVFFPDEIMAAYDIAMSGYSDFVSIGLLSLIVGISAILAWLVGIAVILYLHFKRQYFKA
jgi:hypothetical protein